MSTIVILEDDHTLIDLYSDVLKRAGFNAVAITSLQDVQTYFTTNEADLIVADLRLGATTAEETITLLQKIRDEQHIPVLLISAQMMIYEDQCHQAGFTHLLTKPFPNRVLVQTAEQIIAE